MVSLSDQNNRPAETVHIKDLKDVSEQNKTPVYKDGIETIREDDSQDVDATGEIGKSDPKTAPGARANSITGGSIPNRTADI